MTDNEKVKILIQEANSLNLEALIPSLEKILQSHAFVVDSIYETKPKLEHGEVYQETLLIKMIFTSKSILELSKGINFSILNSDKKIPIIDRSSIYILTRSLLETFLTLEYLFFNNLGRDEQIFRYSLWRISGFMSRQDFGKTQNKEFIEKIEREKAEISQLKKDVKLSPFYSELKDNQLWKLDNYGLPRIISWIPLLKQSVLKKDSFDKVYKLYSNYAHSEFISIIQLNEGKVTANDDFNIETTITTLNNVRILNCVALIMMTNKFEFAKRKFDKLDEKQRFIIEFWNKLAVE
jgi:hypothetical protein